MADTITEFAEYEAEALRTAGPHMDLEYAALSLTGEAGEFSELVKKHEYHDIDLDVDKAIKELGDILWGVNFAARMIGSSLEEVAKVNIQKLKERYPNGFVKGGGNR